MTSITVRSDHWGEAKLSERRARQRRRRWGLMGLGVAIIVGLPLVAGTVGGWSEHEQTIRVLSAVLFVVAASWFAWANWRERDEMERRRSLNTWAALGLASLALNPVLRAAQPLLHLADPAQTAWLWSIIVGGVMLIVQRFAR